MFDMYLHVSCCGALCADPIHKNHQSQEALSFEADVPLIAGTRVALDTRGLYIPRAIPRLFLSNLQPQLHHDWRKMWDVSTAPTLVTFQFLYIFLSGKYERAQFFLHRAMTGCKTADDLSAYARDNGSSIASLFFSVALFGLWQRLVLQCTRELQHIDRLVDDEEQHDLVRMGIAQPRSAFVWTQAEQWKMRRQVVHSLLKPPTQSKSGSSLSQFYRAALCIQQQDTAGQADWLIQWLQAPAGQTCVLL